MSVFLHIERDQNARKTTIFVASNWEFFLKLGKKEDILDWEWGRISDPGDREKRPCSRLRKIKARVFEFFLHIQILPLNGN